MLTVLKRQRRPLIRIPRAAIGQKIEVPLELQKFNKGQYDFLIGALEEANERGKMARFDLPPEDLEDYKITNKDLEADLFVEAENKQAHVLEADIVKSTREEIMQELGP